ncbi:pentatricopeptide repeat-containing protein, mitochondrial [Cinnamomum micranthum f. kanehirae]|uniref:Pentatricopeptide repeat-containing protein, mitochondrial n=1 Tax=Cinnamomum micranthum f. kanehirae TaxID=337451 RepID=A0A3S3M9J8_9MAGN|nr:pentatricopeptide repeat-containing protein, mitochondrial [Cinnamomum micranthum f. kanehirae]
MLKRLGKTLPSKALQVLQKQLLSRWADDLDHVSVSVALKYCSRNARIGTQIHGLGISSGLDSYVTVSNSLMNMYCKSGLFDQALAIFDSICNPDIVSWNTVLSGFCRCDHALEFALRMHYSGVIFDAVTYTTVLTFCSDIQELEFGLQLHSLIHKSGLEQETFVGNALITLYSRCRCLDYARRVFDEMTQRDLVSWNARISGLVQEGDCGSEAIWVFVEMSKEGIERDYVLFSSAISACGHERNLELGQQVHGLALKTGYETHVSVSNVLMSMYSKCEIIEDAYLVFENMIERNVISWTAAISMNGVDAVFLFNEMRKDEVYPNDVTFVGLIHAITVENLVEGGKIVHGLCVRTGFSSELNVSNCFITMYAKFKSMEEAKKVFDDMNYREIISWNALISGYAQNELCQEALDTFSLSLLESVPNSFTLGSVLGAIASAEAASLMQGRQCHCRIIKLGLSTDPYISGALVNMYAKRGSIDESQWVFDEIPQRSLVAWTAIISAHSTHGNYESVMGLFEKMEVAGVHPDSITFLAVFTACGRKGMVDAGLRVFNSMVKEHGIEPSAEHFACMVDMMGRAGRVEEAEEFVQQMPMRPGLSVLQSLLGACRIHGNVEMGKRVAEALMEMEPMESGAYVLISHMYAEKGEWEKVAKIRKGMRERGVKKEVAFSWVDTGDADGCMNMHGFTSDDKSHPKAEEICKMVEGLGLEMRYLENEREYELLRVFC